MSSFPVDLLPMLATRWREPFDDADWFFEVKWDGYRVLVRSGDGPVRITSRRGNDLTATFPEISAPEVRRPLVLDGEVVVFGDDRLPSFHRLQQRNGLTGRAAAERGRTHPATLIVFDVLVDGDPVMDETLEKRRGRLDALDLGSIAATRPVAGDGRSLWNAVVERGLEGIVAKRSGSRYTPGRRSPDWRKVVHRRTMKAVVGGYLPGEGGRRGSLGSVLVGLHDAQGGLRWIGAVGSGFDSDDLRSMRWALDQLVRGESPFVDDSGIPAGAVWSEPGVVVVVEYRELTPDGHLRAPVFKGVSSMPPGEATFASEVG